MTATHGLPVAPVHLERAIGAPVSRFGQGLLGLGGLDRLGLDHWFFGLNRFRLHCLGLHCLGLDWLGLDSLGLDGLGLGLNRFRCCRLRLGGDGCLEEGSVRYRRVPTSTLLGSLSWLMLIRLATGSL